AHANVLRDTPHSDAFFFQAEDGIRDLIVTGVQTCALPIFPRATVRIGRRIIRTRRDEQRKLARAGLVRLIGERRVVRRHDLRRRSEERRVGKGGGRGGWAWREGGARRVRGTVG